MHSAGELADWLPPRSDACRILVAGLREQKYSRGAAAQRQAARLSRCLPCVQKIEGRADLRPGGHQPASEDRVPAHERRRPSLRVEQRHHCRKQGTTAPICAARLTSGGPNQGGDCDQRCAMNRRIYARLVHGRPQGASDSRYVCAGLILVCTVQRCTCVFIKNILGSLHVVFLVLIFTACAKKQTISTERFRVATLLHST